MRNDSHMRGERALVPQFCDISQFQPLIDWQAYKKWSSSGDGVSRVAMRSTYGTGYTDTHFEANRQGALEAGIDVILYYHYAYPQYNTPEDEANWQREIVGNIRDQDMVVLDIEENVGENIHDWSYRWLYTQEVNYGKLPALYASSAYIQTRLQDNRLAKYPLWLANWQYTPDERPQVPSPWTSYEYVQYTNRATNVPGISGTVDADIYLGMPIKEKPVNTPTKPTDHQIKAADDCWNSTNTGSPTGTGIYNEWLKNVIVGKQFGPPLTKEYTSVDWKGQEIKVQEFAHARCEWHLGLLGWYNENGKIG